MRGHLALWMALLSATAWGQDSTPVFRSTTELVLLDVQVIHKKTNTAAAQLQAKDFEISEDGAPQTIYFFSRDQSPLSVVVLFDLTESDRGVLRNLAAGARAALDHLKPEDEVAVMAYAASALVLDGFTRDHARTAAAIARAAAMKSDDAAFFNQAVYQAAGQLESASNPSSRRVILWLTDNLPNLPTDSLLQDHDKGLAGAAPHTEAEAIRRLHDSGSVVMPILLKDRLYFWGGLIVASDKAEYAHQHPDQKDYPPGDAHKYAELTGGFVTGLRGKGVDTRLADVIDSLRARYTIGYHPSEKKPPGTFCRIQVSLSPDVPLRTREWNVLAREGYYRK